MATVPKIATKGQLYNKLCDEDFTFLGFNEMQLFQPTTSWAMKLVGGKEKKLSARDLKMGEHFEKKELKNLSGIGDGLLKFLKSLWNDTLATDRGSRIIPLQRFVITSDIMESTQMLFNAQTNHPLREAEVRFGVTDPIVKGIMRCTEAVVAAEESVSKSDEKGDEGSDILAASLNETPQHQRTLSGDIIPDYRFYVLKHKRIISSDGSRCPVIGIAEVKSKLHFDDRATCQTIGYQISSRSDVGSVSHPQDHVLNTVQNLSHPPLVILICEDQLKFIFFPFIRNGVACVDAIVTPEISLFDQSNLIDLSWLSFICYYIDELFGNSLSFINEAQVGSLTLHPKKTFTDLMEIGDRTQQLENELEFAEEKIKKSEEKIKKSEEKIKKLEEENIQLRQQMSGKTKDTIQQVVAQLRGMGFDDDGGWLTELVKAKGGDIGKVLDALHPSN